MTPARPDGRLPAARPRAGGVARQIWWTSVPIWSIGFLSCAPFLCYAISQRRRRDWAVFAGYLAATVAFVAALGVVKLGQRRQRGGRRLHHRAGRMRGDARVPAVPARARSR